MSRNGRLLELINGYLDEYEALYRANARSLEVFPFIENNRWLFCLGADVLPTEDWDILSLADYAYQAYRKLCKYAEREPCMVNRLDVSVA